MSVAVTHISSFFSPKTYQIQPHSFKSHPKLTLQIHSLTSQLPPRSLLQASRRISNLDDPRNWSRSINSEFADEQNDDYDDDNDDDDDEEEDRSLDLLVRFVSNVFKKISKRARKAVRSVLPVPISSKLVEFSVNGVLLLAFLWVLKALLEVVCTLGSVVFVSILLIRGTWTGVTYLQERRNFKINELEDDHHAWTGTQPAA